MDDDSLNRYPIFKRGNPQLRVFLPNFWLKIVRPAAKQPDNVVQFITSIQMTNYDIKNYLETIYKVPVAEVKSEIMEGNFSRDTMKGYVKKEDDYRRAFVTLTKGQKFTYPEIIAEREENQDLEYKKIKDQAQESYKQFQSRSEKRPGLPGWFNV